MSIGVKRRACCETMTENKNSNILLTYVPIEHDKQMNDSDSDSEMKGFQYVYEKLKLARLCPVSDMCAETFLINLLKRRGYIFQKSSALTSPFNRPIKQHEIQNYSNTLINAISGNDLVFLRNILDMKKHILACNQIGESTLHIAARNSCHQIVQLILKSEESPVTIDDYGRSPLNDALWAISPSFSVIEQLLDHSVDLLFLTDVRGFTPLNYVRKEYVFKLCLFFYSRREKYWPVPPDGQRVKVASFEVPTKYAQVCDLDNVDNRWI